MVFCAYKLGYRSRAMIWSMAFYLQHLIVFTPHHYLSVYPTYPDTWIALPLNVTHHNHILSIIYNVYVFVSLMKFHFKSAFQCVE